MFIFGRTEKISEVPSSDAWTPHQWFHYQRPFEALWRQWKIRPLPLKLIIIPEAHFNALFVHYWQLAVGRAQNWYVWETIKCLLTSNGSLCDLYSMTLNVPLHDALLTHEKAIKWHCYPRIMFDGLEFISLSSWYMKWFVIRVCRLNWYNFLCTPLMLNIVLSPGRISFQKEQSLAVVCTCSRVIINTFGV